jgi:molybdate transport system ATP-binding protein
MQPKPFLELCGISLRLNDRLVFRNTDWVFHRDQNWAWIGANGSGKTLLARAISGEIPISEGEIRYGFRTPSGSIPEDWIVLLSFEEQKALAGESPPAARWFSCEREAAPSVKQFLSQDSVEDRNPFEIRSRESKSRRRYARLLQQTLALLGIAPLMHNSITSLSNGEMRKVLLARALLKNPRLLILDDVFAGLDSRYRVHLRSILDRLMAQRRVHILLLTCDLEALPRGITHLLWISEFRAGAQGPRRAMLRNPGIAWLKRSPKEAPSAMSFPLPSPQRSAPLPEALVEMKDVYVEYDGHSILSGFSWTIRRGESWALVGPNGSGKSTILSLIDGDNPQAYANCVWLFGRRRGSGESIWDLKKRIGRISPELHLHFPDVQTCLETVLSGFTDSIQSPKAPSSRQRRVALNLLEYFGLESQSRNTFGSLSTGLQRMTLLARALIKSPDLLLLDEPCQGLDPRHRDRFLEAIESILRHTQTTIIYVTHVPKEIPEGIVKVLRLENGHRYRTGIRRIG